MPNMFGGDQLDDTYAGARLEKTAPKIRNTKPQNLDQFTFGNSVAAIVLAKRLNELNNSKLTKSVSSYLEHHNGLVNSVMGVESEHYRTSLLHLIGDHVKQYSPPWPEAIVTYVKNVATAKIKKAKNDEL